MRRAIAVALLASLVAAGCKSKQPAKQPPTEEVDPMVAGWRSDLALVAAEITTQHPAPFHKVSEADFRAAVVALDLAIPTLSYEQRLIGLAKVVALIGDSHTNLMPNRLAFAMVVPMRFYWFTDGVFVIAAKDDHREAIGSKVVSVGGHPIDEVIAALSTTFGWESEGFRRQQVAFLLTFAAALRGTRLAPAEGPIKLGLVDASGASRELAVDPEPWRGPAPDANPPLYRKHPNANYWHEYLAPERALYVQYNQCADARQLSFADFTKQVVDTLDHQPVDRLVIDLRFNPGGSSEVIRPLLAVIGARPALRGRVFAIIGRATFSSAIYNAVWLDQAGALLVGEPAGSAASHYGEVRRVPLPGTGGVLVHSTKRHELPGYPDTALPPEVLAEQSSADYFAGRDPAMAAVLAHPVPFP